MGEEKSDGEKLLSGSKHVALIRCDLSDRLPVAAPTWNQRRDFFPTAQLFDEPCVNISPLFVHGAHKS
jgi:hypothetical protein